MPNLLVTLAMPLEQFPTHCFVIGSKVVPEVHSHIPPEFAFIPLGHPQVGTLQKSGSFPLAHWHETVPSTATIVLNGGGQLFIHNPLTEINPVGQVEAKPSTKLESKWRTRM